MAGKSLIMGLRTFFGMKPKQTLKGFVDEMKKLTDEDKKELAEMLKEEGFEIDGY